MNLDINICFSTPSNYKLISRLVRWFTKSKISHCVTTYLDPVFGTRMVLTADPEGFVLIPWERWSKTNAVPYIFKPTGVSLEEAIRYIGVTYLGTKYDYGSFFANAIRLKLSILWKTMGKWIRNKLATHKEVICSESVVRLFQRAAYKFTQDLDPELTDAEALLKVMLQAPKDEIIRIK